LASREGAVKWCLGFDDDIGMDRPGNARTDDDMGLVRLGRDLVAVLDKEDK